MAKQPHPYGHISGDFNAKHPRGPGGRFGGKPGQRDGHGSGPAKGGGKPADPMKKAGSKGPGFGGGLGAANSHLGMIGD